MKKLLTLVAVLFTTVAMAQPPQRPLPNQFRDYVDFRMQQEKPKIEHKDGKVIITMTEQQFRTMRQRRTQIRKNIPGHRPSMPICPCQKRQEAHRKFGRF